MVCHMLEYLQTQWWQSLGFNTHQRSALRGLLCPNYAFNKSVNKFAISLARDGQNIEKKWRITIIETSPYHWHIFMETRKCYLMSASLPNTTDFHVRNNISNLWVSRLYTDNTGQQLYLQNNWFVVIPVTKQLWKMTIFVVNFSLKCQC